LRYVQNVMSNPTQMGNASSAIIVIMARNNKNSMKKLQLYLPEGVHAVYPIQPTDQHVTIVATGYTNSITTNFPIIHFWNLFNFIIRNDKKSRFFHFRIV